MKTKQVLFTYLLSFFIVVVLAITIMAAKHNLLNRLNDGSTYNELNGGTF